MKEEEIEKKIEDNNKDPYNAIRILNREIDCEIENKNMMLKDWMIENLHNDPEQKDLQI